MRGLRCFRRVFDMNKWKPIKSAPKNKKSVLLYGEGYTNVGHYDSSPQLGNYPNWRWGLTIEPTHWLPLPNPPKTS